MSDIGFVLAEQFPAPQALEHAIAAERVGFDRLWHADHFHPWMDNQGHASQAWVTLSAIGQRTERIPFGTGVTCPSYRYHPAIVAQTFATLGLLYPGRVFLGVGTGEALNEQPLTGDWKNYADRIERFGEAIAIIRRLWSGEWVDFDGNHFQLNQARIYDLPDQPVPLYIAAEGENSMRQAGRMGDGLISDSKTAAEPQMRAAFEEGARDAGKDPAQMPILAEHFVVVGGEAEAREAAKHWRFIPQAWTKFVNYADPRRIMQDAEATISDEEVTSN
ncbi:MAG: TIGR03557 family F420-dependent LLM class oxidoreductase [Oscillochloris sp.]|nr:TIGR03557 family F420-dependent LLM class oxidoreductase [Oscillochloris sp.]